MTALQKWTPTTDLLMLRRMGKLIEELGELSVVASRCVIQGIDEVDPGSQRLNRDRLEREIADVYAQLDCTVLALKLNQHFIHTRKLDKRKQMGEWEAMFGDERAKTCSYAGCPDPFSQRPPCALCYE